MPFALVTIGSLMFITALNGTSFAFLGQVYNDVFANKPYSFLYWVLALVVVGMIGYIPKAQKPADAFMVLIIVGMVIATQGGVFTKIQQTIAGQSSTPATGTPLAAVPFTVPTASASSTSSPIASAATGAAFAGAATSALQLGGLFGL